MIEKVTAKELVALKKNKCPDCGKSCWIMGASAGLSQNVMCVHCGSRFNMMPGFGAERIETRPRKPAATGPFR